MSPHHLLHRTSCSPRCPCPSVCSLEEHEAVLASQHWAPHLSHCHSHSAGWLCNEPMFGHELPGLFCYLHTHCLCLRAAVLIVKNVYKVVSPQGSRKGIWEVIALTEFPILMLFLSNFITTITKKGLMSCLL